MSKKKAHKKTKLLSDNIAPEHAQEYTTSWQGRIAIIDPSRSEIAKKIGMEMQGEYAIKVR